MTEAEFLRIYRLIKNKYGIDLDRKKEIVQGRLDNYIRRGGYQSYSEYMNAVESDFTGRLEKELVNILTTNHTFFMREFEHFDFLRQEVLPQLRRKEENTRDLCIWCGAASTGQEPYMLAMLLKDFFGLEHHLWDTKVLATDLSTEALQHATLGRYDSEQIESLPIMVIKKDSTREVFSREKLLKGMLHACQKRPVSIDELDAIIDDIEATIQNSLDREVTSEKIGELVMEKLKGVDEVAYVRFASVYRQFKDINTFMSELNKLLQK